MEENFTWDWHAPMRVVQCCVACTLLTQHTGEKSNWTLTSANKSCWLQLKEATKKISKQNKRQGRKAGGQAQKTIRDPCFKENNKAAKQGVTQGYFISHLSKPCLHFQLDHTCLPFLRDNRCLHISLVRPCLLFYLLIPVYISSPSSLRTQ